MLEIRRVRPFRLGLLRASTSEFKPIATIGLSADGGIWVAPRQVRNYGWRYGIARAAGSVHGFEAHAHTEHTPKLHYHRSGIASVTLTGASIERRRVRFPPIARLREAQVMSIVVERTWELTTKPGPLRKGDMGLLHDAWPRSVAVTLSLVKSPHSTLFRIEDGNPLGLIRGDDSLFGVDFTHFHEDVYLIGRTAVGFGHEPSEPAVTISAVSWSPAVDRDDARSFVLYTDSTERPMVWRDDAAPTGADLRLLMSEGEVFRATPADHGRRLFGSAERDTIGP